MDVVNLLSRINSLSSYNGYLGPEHLHKEEIQVERDR